MPGLLFRPESADDRKRQQAAQTILPHHADHEQNDMGWHIPAGHAA
jgi:hypothetical protein